MLSAMREPQAIRGLASSRGRSRPHALPNETKLLVMPSTVSAPAMPRRTGGVGRLRSRRRGGIAQIGGKEQHQRRNDPESEKRIECRQDSSQVARRPGRKPPGDGAGSETSQRRNGARPRRNLQPRAALRTQNVVRTRRRLRRGNFRLAMRANANSHVSPPFANAYNNRISASMKRGETRRELDVAN